MGGELGGAHLLTCRSAGSRPTVTYGLYVEQKMTSLDNAFEATVAIFESLKGQPDLVVTEEDSKIQIVVRLLTEALGWDHKDLSAERKNDNGYSDFILSDGAHQSFVLEAKKVGRLVLKTQADTQQNYKISGPALANCLQGIAQAASYATPLGIQLAVVTDGYNWIVFLPFVPGSKYQEKQAIVFPGHNAIISDFSKFYELLSKPELRENSYKVIFDQIHENRLIQTNPLRAAFQAPDIKPEQKSPLAFDLEKVFSSFFSSLAGDNDPDLIINCFVETKESRIADFSLERIAANVLGNIGADRTVDEGLNSIIQSTIEGELGQTVFIVGPSGAGKTTFLNRFFKKTLSAETRDRCVVVYINSIDATGDDTTSVSWMTERIIQKIEEQVFADGYPKWNDLRSLYHTDYVKRAEGVDAQLYKRDKDAFREKFSAFIDDKVEKDREGYLFRLLNDIVHNRRKLPILVVDNTDEFSTSFKERVFQYFQALRRSTKHCLLVFPATDRSAWTFSKTEIFNIYSSKSFYLPTPSPREVFRKRVDYLKTKLQEGVPEKTKAKYFAGQGITVKIDDLEGFAAVVENIFVDQDYSAKRIGEIANYNMRKTLNLSKRIITSSVIGIEEIIRTYVTGNMLAPSPFKFMNALLKGDYNFFKADDEHHIFSMFQVDSEIRQSPLTHLRILLMLRGAHLNGSEDSERYLTVKSIYSFFDLMSASESAVERSLIALLAAGLVEPYDLSMKDYSQDQRLAITFSGLCHVEMATTNPTYFEQMALTTRIVDPEIAAQLRSQYLSKAAYSERLEATRKLFAAYLVTEDQRFISIPSTPEFGQQSVVRNDVLAQWTGAIAKDSVSVATFGPLAAEGTVATVDNFDQFRGFGFVSVPELKDTAFLHFRTVKLSGFQEIHDGDDILCDVARNEKGLYVSVIHDVVTPKADIYTATVIRLFDDRGYGFVNINGTSTDAFFHYSLFPESSREFLYEGLELTVEVRSDANGKSQVKRVVSDTNLTKEARSDAAAD